jgi:hypothetical protein
MSRCASIVFASVTALIVWPPALSWAQTSPKDASKPSVEQSASVWTDPATGLLWTKQDNGSNVNWNAARNYCAGLTLGGYSGWRLPEIDQLQQIYDKNSTRTFASLGVTFQYHIKGGIELTNQQWSNTPMSAADKEKEAALGKQLGGVELANGSDKAWIFDFSVGARFPIEVDVPYNKRALCVRLAGK